MHSDLRSWLDEVEKHGELKRIRGADPELEMSGIEEIVAGDAPDPKPVIMFEDIPGYQRGFRTLWGLFGSNWRMVKTLGLPEHETSRMGMLRDWRNKVKRIRLTPPEVVKSGPIQANIETGDQIDLLKFPSPRFHELDGGRYFGTCHAVIQRDPDSGFVNLGTYRVMLVDRNHLALHILEGQHGDIIMSNKYFARGQKMPVAIAVGVDPTLWFASAHRSTPWGVSEYDYTGGIKGQPIKVIEGKYTGLPLPADAEIVVEGECDPDKRVDEGPFGEWHGYYANLGLKPVPEPLIEVKAIYYRDDPILTCQLPTVPCRDLSSLIASLGGSASIWNQLEDRGIHGIKGVWCHADSAGGALFMVVSIEQLYAGHSREVGLIASQSPHMGRYTVVVEEDIDPSDLKQVLWAIATRGRPHESIQLLYDCRSTSADPTIPLEEKLKYKVPPKPLYNSRVLIDACRRMEKKEDWYPIAAMSPELKAKITGKWQGVLSEICQSKK